MEHQPNRTRYKTARGRRISIEIYPFCQTAKQLSQLLSLLLIIRTLVKNVLCSKKLKKNVFNPFREGKVGKLRDSLISPTYDNMRSCFFSGILW